MWHKAQAGLYSGQPGERAQPFVVAIKYCFQAVDLAISLQYYYVEPAGLTCEVKHWIWP